MIDWFLHHHNVSCWTRRWLGRQKLRRDVGDCRQRKHRENQEVTSAEIFNRNKKQRPDPHSTRPTKLLKDAQDACAKWRSKWIAGMSDPTADKSRTAGWPLREWTQREEYRIHSLSINDEDGETHTSGMVLSKAENPMWTLGCVLRSLHTLSEEKRSGQTTANVDHVCPSLVNGHPPRGILGVWKAHTNSLPRIEKSGL
jgi:hypothetical protein